MAQGLLVLLGLFLAAARFLACTCRHLLQLLLLLVYISHLRLPETSSGLSVFDVRTTHNLLFYLQTDAALFLART